MTINANTVNIVQSPPQKRAYHHGDLHSALVDKGMELLEKGDAETLSLREVARAVGVSAPAVYRHFPQKSALLAALATEGVARLGSAQMNAAKAAGYGAAGFNASGRAYVRFALAHPALFKLTMSYTPLIDHFALPDEQVSSPMRLLRDTVAALAPEGTAPALLRAVAIRAWSQVHGLAMLMLDGQIAVDDGVIDSVIDGTEMWPEVGESALR